MTTEYLFNQWQELNHSVEDLTESVRDLEYKYNQEVNNFDDSVSSKELDSIIANKNILDSTRRKLDQKITLLEEAISELKRRLEIVGVRIIKFPYGDNRLRRVLILNDNDEFETTIEL